MQIRLRIQTWHHTARCVHTARPQAAQRSVTQEERRGQGDHSCTLQSMSWVRSVLSTIILCSKTGWGKTLGGWSDHGRLPGRGGFESDVE